MSIGCCYQNLTEVQHLAPDVPSLQCAVCNEDDDRTLIPPGMATEGGAHTGFPMSGALQGLCRDQGLVLGRHTRLLGAQAQSPGGGPHP